MTVTITTGGFLKNSNGGSVTIWRTKFFDVFRVSATAFEHSNGKQTPLTAVTLTEKIIGNRKGFLRALKTFIAWYVTCCLLLISKCMSKHHVCDSIASNTSTLPVPTTSSPLVQSPPPIPYTIPTPTPTTYTYPPIPKTVPGTIVPQLLQELDNMKPGNRDLKQTKLTMGMPLVKFSQESKEAGRIDEAKDESQQEVLERGEKRLARKGLHTDIDKDDSEDLDEVSEQDDSVSGTKIPINPVPVAMKSPIGVSHIVDLNLFKLATVLQKANQILYQGPTQALYEKIKRSDEDFISIGSAEDEKLIKRMNEKGFDSSKSEALKEGSKEEVQKESKEEESTRKRKLGTRKKIKSRKRRYIQNTSEDDSEKENDELRLHLTIAPDEEKEVDYEILDRKYPIKEWKTECLGTKPQTDQAEHIEEINQNVDLNVVYQLVMDKYQDEIPEGFDKVLWGDLMVMFNSDDENEFWNSQLDWSIYERLLKLKLESEEDSTMALELIRFIKKITCRVRNLKNKIDVIEKGCRDLFLRDSQPPSLYIPPPVNRRDDIPKSEQPPRKRLCLSTLGSRYEIGESSTARPTGDRGVDPAEAVPDIAPMTVGEVNTRVTKLAELHKHDTQDLDSMDGGGGGLCFLRSLGSLDRIELGNPSGASDPQRQAQMVETLRVMRDMRQEIGDMQAELLALQEQRRRARQPTPVARILNHQDASGDADSHV
ncbi:hypothetical protein Tco_0040195 [Tanacetum coccineum]